MHGGLGDAVDVPRMLVVIAHEGFDAGQHVFLRVFQPRGHLPLEVKGERIDRALVDEMHLGAHAQEEVVGFLEEPALALGEDFLFDQLGRGHGARVEIPVPEQVLVIAESARSVFHVRFLHGNDAAVLLVEFLLVDQTPCDVGAFLAFDAFAFEFLAEFRDQVPVPGQPARFQHGGLGLQVAVGLGDGFAQGADGMANFEAGVPEQTDDFLHRGGLLGVRFAARVEEHDVHVAERVHLAASVAAESDHGESVGFRFAELLRADLRENVPGKNIDEIAALPDHFASARAARDAQAQAVFLQTPETSVSFEGSGRSFAPRAALEVFGCACENFFEVVTHGRGRRCF